MTNRIFKIAHLMAAAIAAAILATARADASRGEICLQAGQNGARCFLEGAGSFGTAGFKTVDGKSIEGAGPEFEILLMDGTSLSSDNMEATVTAWDDDKLEIAFQSPAIDATVVYLSDADRALVKKIVTVCAYGEGPVEIDSIVVDSLRGIEGATHGGMGQPVFAGPLFFGLESPAAYDAIENDSIILKHYPGWTLAKGECAESYAGVVGFSGAEGVEEAFRRYVDSIRCSVSSNLHYNSWYDVRSDNMSAETFAGVYEAFRENLGKHGVTLNYLTVDDGWQEGDSIWESSKATFPNGFAPLRDILEAGGMEFGLWMPLPGVGLNIGWGAGQGFEANEDNHHYCLAGPKYNAALRERIKRLVEDEGVRYFKHDFNYFECYFEGEPYPHTERHSFEANVNAEAALLDYIHELNPNVFLNVTSNMWLSPWWLPHADALWMGSSDYGQQYGGASLEPRDWAMTYRDGWLHKRLAEQGLRYPMNAIMTHGIIDGVRNRLGGENESFRTWADNVILYFGRGVYMREMYLSPSLMDDGKWAFVAEAAKWAKSMDAAFARTDWIGGDPEKGEAYGYWQHGAGKNWFVLRNPGMDAQTLTLPIESGRELLQVYPYRKIVQYEGGLSLQGHDVLALAELDNGAGAKAEDCAKPIPAEPPEFEWSPSPFQLGGNGGEGHIEAMLEAREKGYCRQAGPAYECHFAMRVDGNSNSVFYAALYSNERHLPNWLEIDGEKMETKMPGEGWRLFAKPLKGGESQVAVRIPFQAIVTSPFSSRSLEFAAHLETETPTAAADPLACSGPASSFGALPPIRDPQRMRILLAAPRQTLDFSNAGFPMIAKPSEADLQSPTAAKLRISLYGTKGVDALRTMKLNGAMLGALPANRFPFDYWEEHVIDVPQNALRAIKMANKFTINDSGDDGFKFKDVQLSIQLADGSWQTTNLEPRMPCNETEIECEGGYPFKDRSKPVALSF